MLCSFSRVDVNWVLDIKSLTSPQHMLLKSAVIGAASDPSSELCQPVGTFKRSTVGHRISPLGTIGFSFPGHVVLRHIEKMLDSLLYNNGIGVATHEVGASTTDDNLLMKIYRIKGVLHVVNDPLYLYLFQGVHDIFELDVSTTAVGSDEDTTGGLNKVIVIGKNLDILRIEENFINCIADFSA